MKKNLMYLCLFTLVALTSCQSCSSEYKDVNEITVKGTDKPLPLADPFVMLHGDTYYAYGTHSDDGIEVYTSSDLLTWKYEGLALDKKDSWGDRWFWAPEVIEKNGLNVGGMTVLAYGFPYKEAPKTYIRKLTLAPAVEAYQLLRKGDSISLTWEVAERDAADFSECVQRTWEYCNGSPSNITSRVSPISPRSFLHPCASCCPTKDIYAALPRLVIIPK